MIRFMKFFRFAVITLLCTQMFSACGKKTAESKPLSGPPQAGALYSLNDGEGGFRVAKVVAVEADVVFVHLFAKRWTSRPAAVEAEAQTPSPVAFSPDTFAGMQPVHMKDGTVSQEEAGTYEAWQKSNTGVH